MGCICNNSKRDVKSEIDTARKVIKKNMTEFEDETEADMENARAAPKETVLEFKMLVFNKINEVRTDPSKFSEFVEATISLIKTDENNNKKFFIEKSEFVLETISLKKGPQAFKDSVNYLKGIYPLPALEYREDLEINMENMDIASWTKREVLAEKLGRKTSELESSYSGFSFHYDINIIDPLLTIVIQVVDDGPFFGQRKANILSHKMKYVGITHSDLNSNDKLCLYLNFAH